MGFEVDIIFVYLMEFIKNLNDVVYDLDIYVFISLGMFRYFIECYGIDMFFNKIVILIGEYIKKILESFGI